MKKKSEAVIAAVKRDLRESSMNYILIAIKHGVGLSFVNRVVKDSGQTRRRGRKPVSE